MWGLFLKIRRLRKEPLWGAAERAVNRVAEYRLLQEAAVKEPMISFCPRCGQLPDGDRRMEEARTMVVAELGFAPPRSDLDFALAWHYWKRRK